MTTICRVPEKEPTEKDPTKKDSTQDVWSLDTRSMSRSGRRRLFILPLAMPLAFVEYQELLLPRLRVGMAGIVDQGVSQGKRAVGHVVTADVVQPVRQHIEHRLLLRTSERDARARVRRNGNRFLGRLRGGNTPQPLAEFVGLRVCELDHPAPRPNPEHGTSLARASLP